MSSVPYRLPLTSDDPNDVMRRAITYAFAVARLYGKADGGSVDSEPEGYAGGGALKKALQAAKGIIAYHGSPHSFDRFDLSKIGTGEGAQAYGHGLYFADNEGVAKSYRDMLSQNKLELPNGQSLTPEWDDPVYNVVKALRDNNGDWEAARNDLGKLSPKDWARDALAKADELKASGAKLPPNGSMYQVRINADPAHFLDWDKPAIEQQANDRLKAIDWHARGSSSPGRDRWIGMSDKLGEQGAMAAMREAGIPGIKYLDQGSRAAGDGSRNYVVFDDKLIDILKKYASGGEVDMIQDKYPSRYLPGVGRQVMADGGTPTYSAPMTGQRTVTAQDLTGTTAPSGQTYGAYTDAGGQKIAAPFVSSMTNGYPVYNIPTQQPSSKGHHQFDLGGLFGSLFGGGFFGNLFGGGASGGSSGGDNGSWWDYSGGNGYAGGGSVSEIDKAIRTAKEIADQDSMSHNEGFSGNVEFAPVRLREPLTGYEMPLGSVPKESAAVINPALDTAERFAPYAFGPAVGGAYDMAVGAKEGSMFDVATGAFGLPGKAAKAAGIIGSTLVGDDAEAGPIAKALNYTRRLTDRGLYSPAAEALAGVKQEKGRVGDFVNAIRGRPGVSKDELSHAGIENAFAPDQSVTRDQLMDYLHGKLPQIQETVYGGATPGPRAKPQSIMDYGQEDSLPFEDLHGYEDVYALRPNNRTYYIGEGRRGNDFSVHGGNGDRIEDFPSLDAAVDAAHQYAYGREPPRFAKYALPEGQNYREVVMHMLPSGPGGESGFRSKHWPQSNVLAHLRMSDRPGNALHLDEIQSDWGQRARDVGVKDPRAFDALESRRNALKEEKQALQAQVQATENEVPLDESIWDVVLRGDTGPHTHPEEFRKFYEWNKASTDKTGPMNARIGEIEKELTGIAPQIEKAVSGVNYGPYIGSTEGWTDLALKRALREAAENNFDKLVWTPGAEHAARYDLSKRVDQLLYKKNEDGTYRVSALVGNNGHMMGEAIPADKLEGHVGRDVAKRIIEGAGKQTEVQGKYDPVSMTRSKDYMHALEGGDLSVGGQGMVDYYDKIVPARLQKLLKKIGHSPVIEMSSHELPQGAGSGPVRGHALHLTPEMREAIMQGLPAFERGGRVGYDDGGVVDRALGLLSQFNPVGTAHAESPLGTALKLARKFGKQTVKNPVRNEFPGIYGDPREIVREAESRVAPESPALKQLFGVTRQDLYDMGAARPGNMEPQLAFKPNARGSAAAEGIMNKKNAQRLIDVLDEAGKMPGLRVGMDPWYVMDPVYQRMEQLFGAEEAARRYNILNHSIGTMSPGSPVTTEINRGLAAHYAHNQGRFGDFEQFGGMARKNRGEDFPADLARVKGHLAHSTSQTPPLKTFLETGSLDMDSPKVPLYIQSSGVPETGFQTTLPVPDAHFTRAVGMADTRGSKDFAVSMKMPEFQDAGPWFRDKVAGPLGMESVPAQARLWGAMSGQTGVDTAIGSPKIEMLANEIMNIARHHDIQPEMARDLVLQGKIYKDGGSVIDRALGVVSEVMPKKKAA